jgi:DNA-binding NarL/FixJ family response regulator
MCKVRVLIVDDKKLLRESMEFIIKQDPEIEVVGCAGNGKEALALCEQYDPDIVLMDILMPVCDGVEGTRLIKAKYRQTKVLILTDFGDDQNFVNAIQNGADGYILKEDLSPEALIPVIKNTAKGFGVFHQNMVETMAKQFHPATHKTEEDKLIAKLAEKEKRVIQLLAEGKSNREIAEVMGYAESYIKKIIPEIPSKLGLENRAQLVAFGERNKDKLI